MMLTARFKKTMTDEYGFTVVEMGVILILLIVFGLGGYYYSQTQNSSNNQSKVTQSTPTPTTSTTKLSTYQNQRFNYAIDYPAELELSALPSGGEDPYMTDSQYVGDEGTLISSSEVDPTLGLAPSMSVSAIYLGTDQDNMSLNEFVNTQGSFINMCQEDTPEETETVVSDSGEQGIKAVYMLKAGCQGAEEATLNDESAFFDARPDANVVIQIFEGQLDNEFNDIVASFRFTEATEFGD